VLAEVIPPVVETTLGLVTEIFHKQVAGTPIEPIEAELGTFELIRPI
jgi:hypothetical protein